MSYRDDLTAANGRIGALEVELEQARQRIAELEGESTALTVRGDTTVALAQDPTPRKLSYRVTLKGALDLSELAEVSEFLIDSTISHERKVSVLPGSLTFTGTVDTSTVEVRVSARRGEVVIRLDHETEETAAGAVFSGIGIGGMAAGATAGVAVLAGAPIAIAAIPFLPVAWYVKRRLHRRFIRRRKDTLDKVFEQLVELIETILARPDRDDESE